MKRTDPASLPLACTQSLAPLERPKVGSGLIVLRGFIGLRGFTGLIGR